MPGVLLSMNTLDDTQSTPPRTMLSETPIRDPVELQRRHDIIIRDKKRTLERRLQTNYMVDLENANKVVL